MPRTILVFFGPPGSGKGTQSDLLSEATTLPAISTGELLRHEQKIGTALGRRAKGMMSQGGLVSVGLVDHLLRLRLQKPDAKRGFILDGYPRNESQFKNFLKLIHADDSLYFIEMQVPDREVVVRLSGRRVCDCGASYHTMYDPPLKKDTCDLCGKHLHARADDLPTVIRKRLKEYHSSIRPLLQKASGRGSLIFVDGERSIKSIYNDLKKSLGEYGVMKNGGKKKPAARIAAKALKPTAIRAHRRT